MRWRAGRHFLLGLLGLLALAACGGEPDVDTNTADATATWRPKAKRQGNLRFATFNIRNFPVAADMVDSGKQPVAYQLETDQDRLRRVLDTLNADVIAVQEIWDGEELQRLVDRLAPEYTYQAVFATNDWSPQHVGLLVNTAKLTIEWKRDHPEVDITKSMRSGLSVRLVSKEDDGVDLTVMALHLASGESPSRGNLRRQQAEVAAGIVAAEIEELGDDDYLVLGDLNTARGEAELVDIDAAFAGADLSRRANGTGCTAYFAENSKKPAVTGSVIDQVYIHGLGELDGSVPLLSGTHCAVHQCQGFESRDLQSGGTYWSVSDHCPVYFEIEDAGDDP